jgi:hypothetical protein
MSPRLRPRHGIEFPQARVERSVTLLQVALRRIFRLAQRHRITLDDARHRGHNVINTQYTTLLAEINVFYEDHGLHSMTGQERELQQMKTQTLSEWSRIVDDLSRISRL